MASFIAYDLVFLVLFTLAVVIFLYKKRRNLQRQGLLYLYRTRVGIEFIDWTSLKFPRLLKGLQYVVVFFGYILTIGMVYLLINFSYTYITSPVAAEALKVPVIVPLIPYLPEIFNLDFLPPFYFTYWIIIIAIIAIPHEFAHGIFARLNKIKIHSTGFGFLGPFLAAFVEPDEKQMDKIGRFPQMSILASGTFANVVFGIIFGLIFWLFFSLAFTPAGVYFNSYASNIINVSSINSINGINIANAGEIPGLINESFNFTEIGIPGQNKSSFVSSSNFKIALENNAEQIIAITDSPAFRARLSGAIRAIDGVKVTGFNELGAVLKKYKPGDSIIITTIQKNGEIKEQAIKLEETGGKTFLGIGILQPERKGIMGGIYSLITKIKDPFTYYQSSLGDFGFFIYNLLWWCILISLSVALVNMLPLGIFDGGKFFFLTVWGITGKKRIGEVALKISTYLILLLIVALMVRWVFIFI